MTPASTLARVAAVNNCGRAAAAVIRIPMAISTSTNEKPSAADGDGNEDWDAVHMPDRFGKADADSLRPRDSLADKHLETLGVRVDPRLRTIANILCV